jgi:uncharacterized repeat protein (TIGR01451 family)
VRVDEATPSGTVITNQAISNYEGAGSQIPFTVESNPVTSTSADPPLIQVVASGPAQVLHGDDLDLSYEVTNPGDVPLSSVDLSDDTCSPVTGPVKSGGNQDDLLEPGESWAYACTTPVPAHTAGEDDPITNTATATGQNGATTATDTDGHSTDIAHPGIAVDKQVRVGPSGGFSDGPVQAQVADELTYRQTVTNTGDSPLTVTVDDPLCNSGTLSGPTADADDDSRLDLSETWTYTCTHQLSAADPDPLVNTAVVTGTDPAGNTDTDEDSTETGATPIVDIALEKTGDATASVGDTVAYTLAVTNDGSSDGTGVTVTDTLPAGVGFDSAVPSQGSCSESGGTVTCDLGEIADGAGAQVEITVSIPVGVAGQALTNAADAAASELDSNTDNNSDTADTQVRPAADLEILKTAPAEVAAGDPIAYTLAVTNDGPSDATGVTVTDTLPAGVGFDSAVPSQGSCSESGGTVTCDLGEIAAGAGAQILVGGTVDPVLGGQQVTNAASVAGSEDDPEPGDNSDDADSNVVAPPLPNVDLDVDKRIESGFPRVGERLTYLITVTNLGPGDATGVTLTDTLSLDPRIISISPSQGDCEAGPPIQCTLGDLVDGQAATVRVVLKVLQTGPLSNTASAIANESDPTLSNNQAQVRANATVALTKAAISKRASKHNVDPGESFVYRIEFRNRGRAPALAIKVCDQLPNRLILLSAPGGSYDSDRHRVCWRRKRLAAGKHLVLKVHVRVKSNAPRRVFRNVVWGRGDNFKPVVDTARILCSGDNVT